MTIKFRNPSLIDKLLKLLGKKRAFYVPVENGRYCYSLPQPESFFRALLRPAGKPLPEGLFYLDDVVDRNGSSNCR